MQRIAVKSGWHYETERDRRSGWHFVPSGLGKRVRVGPDQGKYGRTLGDGQKKQKGARHNSCLGHV